jgi:hypothetical protein
MGVSSVDFCQSNQQNCDLNIFIGIGVCTALLGRHLSERTCHIIMYVCMYGLLCARGRRESKVFEPHPTQERKKYNVFCGKQMMRSSRICWAQKNSYTYYPTYNLHTKCSSSSCRVPWQVQPFSFELLYFILKIPCPKKMISEINFIEKFPVNSFFEGNKIMFF